MAYRIQVGLVRNLWDLSFIVYSQSHVANFPVHSVITCETKRVQFMEQRRSFISIALSPSSSSFTDACLFRRQLVIHTKTCSSFPFASGGWKQCFLTTRSKSDGNCTS